MHPAFAADLFEALEFGKHVLVEKPPAMRGDEMGDLVATAERHNKVLMPGHLLLYHPGVRKLKQLQVENTRLKQLVAMQRVQPDALMSWRISTAMRYPDFLRLAGYVSSSEAPQRGMHQNARQT